ncbi:hypothetical protein BU16DRAFT_586239 [Lophium mytilinum]|uniref:Uncharacterized protein n=1 Tax=Lophium mytilinum TaxID=390894 RepID=A0A6A6QAK6_9PEZI|nr:hypothetical protein BU16DRAFT_586239 [Lophium mytilinum]
MSLVWKASEKIDDSRISFLDLSLELREPIYEELLVFDKVRTVTYDPKTGPYKLVWYQGKSSTTNNVYKDVDSVIMTICRQLYAEATHTFRTRNTFISNQMLYGLSKPIRLNTEIENISTITLNDRRIYDTIASAVLHFHLLSITEFEVPVSWSNRPLKMRPWLDGPQLRSTQFQSIKKGTFVMIKACCCANHARGRICDCFYEGECPVWKFFRDPTEEITMAAFNHAVEYWKEALGWNLGRGVPEWVEFRFDPPVMRILCPINGRPVYVDLAEVWAVLKKCRPVVEPAKAVGKKRPREGADDGEGLAEKKAKVEA